MIPIQKAVKRVLLNNPEASNMLHKGLLNLSAYANTIRKPVEDYCRKEVSTQTIVVSLSRIKHKLKGTHPLLTNVRLNNIVTYAPLTEVAFFKSTQSLQDIATLYSKIKTSNSNFLTTTIGTNSITIICSQILLKDVLNCFNQEPVFEEGNLAAIGLSFDPKYYYLPNITYSLLSKIAAKKIPLAETITSHKEIIFIFNVKSLPEILNLFT